MIRDLEARHEFEPGDKVVLTLKEGYLEFQEVELVCTYRGEDDHALLVEVANWIPVDVVESVEVMKKGGNAA
jgi:hypothetical protein